MFDTSRRRLIGPSLVGAGALLSGIGLKARAEVLNAKGRILLDGFTDVPPGLVEAMNFPLVEAIHGRRSRRFAKGASIPDGPLAFTSRHAPTPLSDLEQMILLTTVAGNTGWLNLFAFNQAYAPKIPNYQGAPAVAPSPRPLASTQARSSSPTTAAPISCRRGTCVRPGTASKPTSRRVWSRIDRGSSSSRTSGSTSRGRRRTWKCTTPGAPTYRAARL